MQIKRHKSSTTIERIAAINIDDFLRDSNPGRPGMTEDESKKELRRSSFGRFEEKQRTEESGKNPLER